MIKARCMRCGTIHPHFRFKNQICYLMYCEGCESTMIHEPFKSVNWKLRWWFLVLVRPNRWLWPSWKTRLYEPDKAKEMIRELSKLAEVSLWRL